MGEVVALARQDTWSASFTVPGTPVGQPRHRVRVVRRGDKAFPQAYSADGGHPIWEWRNAVARAATPHRPDAPLLGPVAVLIALRFAAPKSRTRVERGTGRVVLRECVHVSKPDVDNAAKAILDELTALGFWADDAQVCDLCVTKRWALTGAAEEGARPGALVEVTTLEEAAP